MLQKNKKDHTRYSTPNFPKIPMSTQIKNPPFDDSYFQHHLPQIYRTVLKDFRRIVQSHLFFHIFFLVLLAGELIAFLPFFSTSAMAALALGVLFLTGFSYLVLHFYTQARKPERLILLKEAFIDSCRRHSPAPVGEAQHHLSIADALLKLASYLEDFEKNFYRLPPFMSPIFSKLSSLAMGKMSSN